MNETPSTAPPYASLMGFGGLIPFSSVPAPDIAA